MVLVDRKLAMHVAATHTAKQAVELVGCVHTMAEHLGAQGARWNTEAICARVNIAAIRRELDDLEALISGKELRIPIAPSAA